MDLGALIEGLGITRVGGPGSAVRVCDLTEDSRTVMPGSLFIARRGLKVDGRAFAQTAADMGAAAILSDDPALRVEGRREPVMLVTERVAEAAGLLAERFHGMPGRSLRLVGVTGTNGKTTVTTLVHRLLNGCGVRCGLIGTVEIDDGREIAPAVMTTPPAIEVSRSLASMVEGGCVAAALEVSSHALTQARVAALDFDVAVFTNLTGDHQDYHTTMDDYAGAKATLFERLDAGAVAVVNADDAHAERMVRDCGAEVLRCSAHDGSAGAFVRGIELTSERTRAVYRGGWGEVEATTQLIGGFNLMNTLQAVAACWRLGAPIEAIAEQLGRVAGPTGRLERVSTAEDDVAVFVDFAHSDDSLRQALLALRRTMAGGRLWVVFGCGGDKDRTKRPRMGAAAGELGDAIVLTSDNPRTEKPSAIISEIVSGIARMHMGKLVHVEPRREAAISHAIEHASAGDVVLIAGKGHEREQISADDAGNLVSRAFDDHAQARTALRRRARQIVDERRRVAGR